jgi:hypothetical protein
VHLELCRTSIKAWAPSLTGSIIIHFSPPGATGIFLLPSLIERLSTPDEMQIKQYEGKIGFFLLKTT